MFHRFVPNCASADADAVRSNTIKAAYWDAAEKYYSVCMHGRTSVGNPVGQYNPNGRDGVFKCVNDPSKFCPYLNPDARYNDLYNILYVHNAGTDRADGNSYEKVDGSANNALPPTTYNPESFAGEVRLILPPALAAAFPTCIRQGTSTPSGSVSATVVQGAPVILPIRCGCMLRPKPSAQHALSHFSRSRTFVEASSTILYSAFARIEADTLPAGSSVVASTAPGVSSILSSSLPAWALFSGLNVFVLSGATAAGTAFTRLRTNAIRFACRSSASSSAPPLRDRSHQA